MSGCPKGLVPMDNVLMVQGSMKLCVAPQSSSTLIWVVLCHMLTVKGIVIEFFCVLYMWATDARGLQPLSSSRPKILTHVSGIQVLHPFFLSHGLLYCTDLLGFSEFWSRGSVCGFFCGCFSGFGLAIVGVLWAAACHVALQSAPKTSSFSGQFVKSLTALGYSA